MSKIIGVTVGTTMNPNKIVKPEAFDIINAKLDEILSNQGVDTSDATATADKVLKGETFYGADGKETGTMENNGYGVGDFTASLDADNPRLELNGAYGGEVHIEFDEDKTITENGTYKLLGNVTVAVEGEAVEVWNGTGVVIAPTEPEEPIEPETNTFNISGVGSFDFVIGMTFAEWCDSKYNTAGFYCDENGKVCYGDSGYSIKEAGANDAIVVAADYTLVQW